ncbi:MAG TPA: bile acid:sodium symporter family protein [Novosphingobium sp.]|nr:bile acid:sodium symporter family protein [Novosphingobium sp.]
MLSRIDPMVRLILAAMLLASLLPASGTLRPVVQGVADVAVFVLFGLYGLKLARADVRAGLANLRLLMPLALWVFGAMALAGWGLWQAFSGVLPPLLALGFLYLGVLPSTVQSATVYTSQAGGNVAMSVIAAALLNLLGVVVSAPLFALMAGTAGGGLHAATFLKVATMMLLPFVLGQAFQGRAGGWVKANRPTVTFLERGTIALAVYVSFSGAVSEGVWQRIDAASWGWLGLGCAGLLVLGYGGSWLLGGILGLSRADRIAMVFAGAQKSVAMGAPLASVMFKPAAAGLILLPLVVYHLAQMIVAAPIAGKLAQRG